MTEPAPGTSNPESATTPASDDTSGDTTTLVADTVPPLDPVRLDELEEAMRDVVDPELGINVVDLGLVYGISESEDAVTVDMTLTSAACPLTDVIEDQARNALVRSGLCPDLRINWVWMPPWGPDKITDDGREQLRALGFTV
ncbi:MULTISPECIES: metal-sulfur cluster assembly factor [unclassified Rhodococcus (in: high G+C Gram-positive bacteria)]|jgi:metal-sulfur cluster biosynthetic enzyme|uniref:metal-sulfur cluster assembly factor n=1 Tax=unclassified Rhodococcus (in: high G+C Gram-positive bacteria) TaxID=192944 RepID=UPI00146BD07D|nr:MULTISPECIES: metal-sulfur cluster assembly factor [unclassified Rhodococcus (in: high G+C Gram-positive bacteria)]MBF0662491.1 metal-sulfur cluster assembly factor [Rhodococcus sp. (in: high G+C Gram-positive bacteria)]NMD96592.1 metal-sulfur cluster assembly factor [Rhodococcus sp. BL-253-APC-6A1W]NME79270.1 metal-sulfur cluster assembly factor [Rhodococcus sp. 105337]